jgi:hypothetical protein
MKTTKTDTKLSVEHGVVASYPDQFFGYFGWPSIARMDDGELVVAASGLRNYHVCPFGRVVICTSRDDGRTWTSPRIIVDTPLSDGGHGILSLGGRRLLVTWCCQDCRGWTPSKYENDLDSRSADRWAEGLARVSDESAARFVGSWVQSSDDGGITWSDPTRISVSGPHGPIRLANGDLFHIGRELTDTGDESPLGYCGVSAIRSSDDGRTWQPLGRVPLNESSEFNEPHAVELADGRILGLIRHDPSHRDYPNRQPGETDFTMFQTVSSDGGNSWTPAEPLGFHGAPPHLLLHSSGALICAYGYREIPFGVRVMLSRDDGGSWEYDYLLRDDGPHPDLGYPASVELGDGSVLTVYYQRPHSADDKCGLFWTRWRLPS